MKSLLALSLLFVASCSQPEPASPEGEIDWDASARAWQAAWTAVCPHNNLDMIAPGVELELLDQFAARLRGDARREYDERLSPAIEKWCDQGGEVRYGSDCPVTVRRHFVIELDEVEAYANYSCDRQVCTEQSICDAPETP